MARRARRDEPGAWHHVYNRAISRRPAFLGREDYRYFLSCIARVVHLGLLEVHVFCLLRTHFHLLVRSSIGRLDEALKRIQNRYSRYLNRRLRRDGALWHNRYKSKRVDSNRYHTLLVSYIDSNPVAAAGACRRQDFAWGSAAVYARLRRPRWLETSWVDARVADLTGRPATETEAYQACFPVRCSAGFLEWVEQRLNARDGSRDALDDLISAEPKHVRDWLRRKAALADGVVEDLPLVPAAAVLAVCTEEVGGEWVIKRRGQRVSAQPVAMAGLLRDSCRLSVAEIGRRLHCSPSTAHGRVEAHREAVLADIAYASRAAGLLVAAIERSFVGPTN